MRRRSLSIAARFAQAWTALYTLGMPAAIRFVRRQEIASDLWECCAEVHRGDRSGPRVILVILARLFLGMPDDILWRWEYHMNSTLGKWNVPWWIHATGLGVSFTALMLFFATGFLSGLDDSAVSEVMRSSAWIFPAVLTLHVISICGFIGFAVMVDLRIAGWTLRRSSVLEVGQSLLPWAMAALVTVVISGALLYIADAARLAGNLFFQFKIGLLVIGGLNAWATYRRVYQHGTEWDRAGTLPSQARVACAFSLLVWGLLIVAGRLMAFA